MTTPERAGTTEAHVVTRRYLDELLRLYAFERAFTSSLEFSSHKLRTLPASKPEIVPTSPEGSELALGLGALAFRELHPPIPDAFYNASVRAFIEEERKHDFPFIYRLQAIWLCTLIETCVHDLATTLIHHDPDVVALKAFRGLNGDLIEFMRLDRWQQSERLMHAVRQNLDCPYGIDRLEGLLCAVGLAKRGKQSKDASDVTSEDVTLTFDVLRELFAVRNVLVHQAGRVDERLLKTCPWLRQRYLVGDDVALTYTSISFYLEACLVYWALLSQRLGRIASQNDGVPYIDAFAKSTADEMKKRKAYRRPE